MSFRHGDKVWIRNLGVEGEVIVVRLNHKGELVERHFAEEDLERLPTTKEWNIDHEKDIN